MEKSQGTRWSGGSFLFTPERGTVRVLVPVLGERVNGRRWERVNTVEGDWNAFR